jgi:hypothetical protein
MRMDWPRETPEQPPYTKRRIYAVLLIILLDAMLILALMLFFPFFTGSPNRSLTSFDWAGYAVASDLVNPQPEVTRINASWTVPAVNGPEEGSFSASWIGVGGQFDETLIQAGTEQNYVNGHGLYSAWYELLPRNSVTIDSLSLSAGDNITASITLIDPTANTWSIEVNDQTKGQMFQRNFTYNSSRLSAEWIVERPTVGNRISTLADFGEMAFSGCTASLGGKVGTISSFPNIRVTMDNRQDTQLVAVSSLASGGTSFTLNYIS